LLSRALASVDVTRMILAEEQDDWDFGEYAAKAILGDPEFTKTEADLAPHSRDESTFFETLDPYVILRLLCENRANLEQNLIWRFQDVLESGWINEDGVLYEGLDDTDRYLIVTEGSSDTSILQTSLALVHPDVADFFNFIDMSENYPSTGTGNLFRFCQGLATIRIQNKTLVVLDNDTTGMEALQRIRKISMPGTMHVACLPDLNEFADFKTIGPSGELLENVNGKAVSIECFLDLKYGHIGAPAIRWTSFNRDLGTYQGELVNKEQYTRAFFDYAGKDPNYSLSKLSYLWQCLLNACVA
jgi:hypothetical protein